MVFLKFLSLPIPQSVGVMVWNTAEQISYFSLSGCNKSFVSASIFNAFSELNVTILFQKKKLFLRWKIHIWWKNMNLKQLVDFFFSAVNHFFCWMKLNMKVDSECWKFASLHNFVTWLQRMGWGESHGRDGGQHFFLWAAGLAQGVGDSKVFRRGQQRWPL